MCPGRLSCPRVRQLPQAAIIGPHTTQSNNIANAHFLATLQRHVDLLLLHVGASQVHVCVYPPLDLSISAQLQGEVGSSSASAPGHVTEDGISLQTQKRLAAPISAGPLTVSPVKKRNRSAGCACRHLHHFSPFVCSCSEGLGAMCSLCKAFPSSPPNAASCRREHNTMASCQTPPPTGVARRGTVNTEAQDLSHQTDSVHEILHALLGLRREILERNGDLIGILVLQQFRNGWGFLRNADISRRPKCDGVAVKNQNGQTNGGKATKKYRARLKYTWQPTSKVALYVTFDSTPAAFSRVSSTKEPLNSVMYFTSCPSVASSVQMMSPTWWQNVQERRLPIQQQPARQGGATKYLHGADATRRSSNCGCQVRSRRHFPA